MAETDAEKLERFKKELIDDSDVVDNQRDKANEDMRFINVAGGMWEGFYEDNDNTPTRVKLELDIVSNYLNRFIGEWNQNRVGVEYKPDDASTSDEDSELLNGIYRADFRQNSGKLATDNMVDEIATCGYGAFHYTTVFEDEDDPENDNQRIEWTPVYNAYNTVFWDQAALRIDKRDARHCTILTQFTRSSFEAAFPGFEPASAYDPETRSFENLNVQHTEIIYVGTRYEVMKKNDEVFVYDNLRTGEVEVYSEEDHELIKEELQTNEFRVFKRKRKMKKQIVEKTVFSGDDILEPTRRIAGKWIPVIPGYGIRSYVDGAEWYRGLVRKLKDAARIFNMQMSQLTENASTVGQEVPIFDPEQMLGTDIPALWANKNNKPYLLARSLRDEEGNIVHSGPVGYSKPSMLDQSTAALLDVVPKYVQDMTGIHPGEAFSKDMSGKAINALRKMENMNTQVINDNISNAIAWSGEVYQSMAAEIYTNPRMIRILNMDGSERQVQLMSPALDEKTGVLTEINNLRGKRFRSYADVGPQYETLREQTVEDLKGMLESLGDSQEAAMYRPIMMSLLLENMDGVGLDPLKEMVRRQMLLSGMVKPQTEEEAAMLEKAQNPGPDKQEELIDSIIRNQDAESRNKESDSFDNIASAQKKVAETEEIRSKIPLERGKLLLEAQRTAAMDLN